MEAPPICLKVVCADPRACICAGFSTTPPEFPRTLRVTGPLEENACGVATC
jgi:hypothetical protein